MRRDLLNILECPYCGGELAPQTRAIPYEIEEGILVCDCCAYPVAGGIPYLRTGKTAEQTMKLIGAGDAAGALALLLGVSEANALTQLSKEILTFREGLALLGKTAESSYLLYRFSDPGYLASSALVESIAASVARSASEPFPYSCLDLCGGTGHLTRAMRRVSNRQTVLADLEFWKLYLAKRFIAPQSDAVCCNANEPLPFKPRLFPLTVCADAFHYIWSKRQLAGELERVTTRDGAVVLPHLHNSLQWNPSQGMPLSPPGYARLFPNAKVRLYDDNLLLRGVLHGAGVDLSPQAEWPSLTSAPVLDLVSSSNKAVFVAHPRIESVAERACMNPLYTRSELAAVWKRTFPSEDYRSEHAACLEYLPETVTLSDEQVSALNCGAPAPALDSLMKSRVVLDLPPNYA